MSRVRIVLLWASPQATYTCKAQMRQRWRYLRQANVHLHAPLTAPQTVSERAGHRASAAGVGPSDHCGTASFRAAKKQESSRNVCWKLLKSAVLFGKLQCLPAMQTFGQLSELSKSLLPCLASSRWVCINHACFGFAYKSCRHQHILDGQLKLCKHNPHPLLSFDAEVGQCCTTFALVSNNTLHPMTKAVS